MAPSCRDWEFHYAKPPKDWNLNFIIQNEKCNDIQIEAGNWKYVLLKYPDNKFEIIFEAKNTDNLSNHTRLLAAQIVLDGVLGEEKNIELMDGVEVVSEFDGEFKTKGSDIIHLLAHLDSLI